MPELTIIIPVGPLHTDVWHDAADSVEFQTVKCDLIVQHDTHGKGSGWARNQGIASAQTTHVAFLDADDILDPHFAEVTLAALDHYRAAGKTDTRYVYTDWYGHNLVRYIAPAPCDVWTEGTFHLVTAVVPTQAARAIGGFDEAMTGIEDADFYVRLRLSGLCGLHVEKALVTYREGGMRSIQARADGTEDAIKRYMTHRYGGYNLMGCCGDTAQHPLTPENEPTAGDVLAQAQWMGNMRQIGRATGRIYQRTSFPKLLYVHASDVDAAPQHWKRVTTPVQAANGVVLQPAYQPNNVPWQDIANAMQQGTQPAPAPTQVTYKPNITGRKKADVLQEWSKVEGDIE